MCFEVLSFFSIFTNAFIILIVQKKEHYFLACNVLVLNVITLGIAYINDALKDKVRIGSVVLHSKRFSVHLQLAQVSLALYELPWDEMRPKQRTFIQLTMKCSDADVTFNCAKIHEFNLERFGNITKQAYSNALYLKKMLEKSMVSFE